MSKSKTPCTCCGLLPANFRCCGSPENFRRFFSTTHGGLLLLSWFCRRFIVVVPLEVPSFFRWSSRRFSARVPVVFPLEFLSLFRRRLPELVLRQEPLPKPLNRHENKKRLFFGSFKVSGNLSMCQPGSVNVHNQLKNLKILTLISNRNRRRFLRPQNHRFFIGLFDWSF